MVDVPDLRIVDEALWERAKARQREVTFTMGRDDDGNALNRAHRRRFLFFGLLECGECGGGYSIMAHHRYGCSTHRSSGTCSNTTTIGRRKIETRILAGLRERLLSPEMIAQAIAGYPEEANRQQREAEENRSRIVGEFAAVERKIAAMLRAIEDGMYAPSMKERMAELEARRSVLEAELAHQPEVSPVRLHPQLAELYRLRVAELEEALNDDADRTEAQAIIRSLIDRVVLSPAADGGMDALLYGELAGMLALADGGSPKANTPAAGRGVSRMVSVVAGARNSHCLLFFVRGLRNVRQIQDVANATVPSIAG